MPKYIFTYQTICTINNKSYVGVHSTNDLNDGYIGCGIYCQGGAKTKNSPFHNAVRKHGYKNFKKYILDFYTTYEDALAEEKYLANEDWVKSGNNYNCALGGKGSPFWGMSEERKKEIFEKNKGENNHRYGKAAHNRRIVLKYSISNELIGKFDSLTAAAIDVGVDVSNIKDACIGKNITCRGFIFRYEIYSENEKSILDNYLSNRHITYNNDGSFTVNESLRRSRTLPRVGKKRGSPSEEARKKMAIAKIGKKRLPHSEETKIKMSNSHSLKKKAVIQYNLDDEIITEYESMSKAAIMIGCNRSSILDSINGRIKSCKGYVFKYKNM